MNNKEQVITILAKYVTTMLNISVDNDFIILDIQEELESINDLVSFRNYIKEAVASPAKEFEYKTGIQKFLILSHKFKEMSLCITEKEQDTINLFCSFLYKKVTWYFDLLQDLLPTVEQLKVQIWKNHQYMGKDLINEKESMVIDEIGDTPYIYRLATLNKPLLQEKIIEITKKLVKNKKRKQLSLYGTQEQRVING